MTFDYTPQGVCSQHITFDLVDGNIHNTVFTNGCNGNLKAIAKLIEGRPAKEIAALFRGHQCKDKGTSCADQFSRALEAAIRKTAQASG
ncbi:MAG: TIGR03905 family TSCPD domain-containing protein [Treponemataceae bacterium]|nr:MAG: TIGR03905 family TSCPD domain-containing protein [Treponemataceae bacterium]